MAFVKPYTYIDTAVLNAADQESNEQALQTYVNQEIITTDISAQSINGDNIATPRYISSVNNMDFVTKTIQGNALLRQPQQYAWFSSTTKTDAQVSTTVEDWQHVMNSGAEIFIPPSITRQIMYTAYIIGHGYDNNIVIGNGGPINGLWDNNIQIQIETDGVETRYSGSRQYVFEGAGVSSGAVDPDAGGNASRYRAMMFTRILTLPSGYHKLCLVVNPKLERMNISCQSYFIETFFA
jgi:hypothetical protein